MDRTFILGVGAQKAGTTWLYDYLANRPEFRMGYRKEYHILDALHVPECNGFRLRSEQNVISSLQNKDESNSELLKDLRSVLFYENVEEYYDYFQYLMLKSGCPFSADFTPSYSGLSTGVLTDIRRRFRARGIGTKAIFIMRDPVERMISMVRMEIRNSNGNATQENEIELIKKRYNNPAVKLRADYKSTIESTSAAFKESDFLVLFFEELFSDDKIAEVCSFLNLPFISANLDNKKNVSETSNTIPMEVRSLVAKECSDVLEYCADKFGSDRMRSLWPSYKLL